MSQNDFTIGNQGFPAFRADLNSALQALASNNSGATEPSTTFANMWWYDSSNNIMYIRNEDNDAWIKFAELDQTNDKFVLSGTLQLDDGTVSAPALTFNSDTNMGIYRGGTDILKFVTAGTDAVTIDASQNLLVGTSTILTAEDNVEGISLASGSYGGLISASRNSNRVATFNRGTDNGDIVEFRQAGSVVGSISSNSGSRIVLNLGGNNNAGFTGAGSSNAILPTLAGSTDDNTVDLGASSVRYNDLYLGGGAYLGGTGSANFLDSYEEGTFTPVLADAQTGGNLATFGAKEGNYTKIGRQVTCRISITNINTTGMTGSNVLWLRDLPFTVSKGLTAITRLDNWNFNGNGWVVVETADNATQGRFFNIRDNTSDVLMTVDAINNVNADLAIHLTYFV